MATKVFINLPVKDLNATNEFFTKLGYQFNSQFSNDKATCMVVSEHIYIMLLVEDFFKGFTNSAICDTSKSNEVIVCLSADSREAVDEIVKKAVDAGATTPSAPQDHGFMYGYGFTDLDGHLWEFSYMDPTYVHQA
ncbi:VOC family protein [Mucilaginibacter lacusdianchii]|uniref:VOC family protein n=1 Tax=Mucilaginibacter lacusdianchii TaxID=2684211 RepID=UPI00131E7B2F|nr:VOC family protein [Mucilaginibacter sp. JXJ CY 39]